MKRTKVNENYDEMEFDDIGQDPDEIDGSEAMDEEYYEEELLDEELPEGELLDEEYEEYDGELEQEEADGAYEEYEEEQKYQKARRKKSRRSYEDDDYEQKNPYRGLVTVLGMLLMLAVVGILGAHLYFKYWSPEAREATVESAKMDEAEFQAAVNNAVMEKEKELQEKMQGEYSQGISVGESQTLGLIRQNLQDGMSIEEMLRNMYSNELVVASGGQYHFVPIDDTLAKNDYAMEDLTVSEDGEIQYVQGGNVVSYKGIDVSKQNGSIDWKKVADEGITFAYIRAGYRGYGVNGKLTEDSLAKENLQGANDAGIKTGVYFYTQAVTEAEAKEEANMVLNLIKPYQIDCPVVIYVKRVADSGARMNALSINARTKIVKTFCEAIKTGGYRPMIYFDLEMATVMLDLSKLEDYDKWLAYYSNEFYYPYAYRVWQYSDKGRVKGVGGYVDLSIAFEPLWK